MKDVHYCFSKQEFLFWEGSEQLIYEFAVNIVHFFVEVMNVIELVQRKCLYNYRMMLKIPVPDAFQFYIAKLYLLSQFGQIKFLKQKPKERNMRE